MSPPTEHHHKYFLTAGECGAQGTMPVTLLVERIIETATEHANQLDIGYSTLIKTNIGWVLSRLSFEMERWPAINESYALTTWIESYNRCFSDRCFAITDGDGNVIGHARTVWTAIDMARRTLADLSIYERDAFPVSSRVCPIEKNRRLGALPADAAETAYRFRYCDIDFNRHVNTVRYIELLLNQWDMDRYDHNAVRRLDISFQHECYFGEEVTLRVATHDDRSDCEIVRDSTRVVGASIFWRHCIFNEMK